MENKLLPVSLSEIPSSSNISNVHFYHGETLHFNNYDIALLHYEPELGRSFRKELYKLQVNAHGSLAFIDLGDAFAMTHDEIAKLVSSIVKNKCYPVLIGFPESLVISISKQWENEFLPHHVCWVNSTCNFNEVNPLCDHIFLKQQYFLGIQRQMSDMEILESINHNIHMSFISEYRKSAQSIECLTRNSELFYFNMQSVRHSDFPASKNPSGFFSEEIISLAKSTGSSDRSLITMVSDWRNEDNDYDSTSSLLVAQMVWYMMEGYILKLKDKQTNIKNLIHYVVELKNTSIHLDFYKSEISGKWWLQEPSVDDTIQGKLIPCTYEEYVKTVQENIPDRLMNLISN
ncbi:MAG: hypothetical protein HOP11_03940 [Saprospiraceae bacterium]|nr:hypothetical protein [Saprospiraceae bacterium]